MEREIENVTSLELDASIANWKVRLERTLTDIAMAGFKAQRHLDKQSNDEQSLAPLRNGAQTEAKAELSLMLSRHACSEQSADDFRIEQLVLFNKNPEGEVRRLIDIAAGWLHEAQSASENWKHYPSTADDLKKFVSAVERGWKDLGEVNYFVGAADSASHLLEKPTAAQMDARRRSNGAQVHSEIYTPSYVETERLICEYFAKQASITSPLTVKGICRNQETVLGPLVKTMIAYNTELNKKNGTTYLPVTQKTVLGTMKKKFRKSRLVEMAKAAINEFTNPKPAVKLTDMEKTLAEIRRQIRDHYAIPSSLR